MEQVIEASLDEQGCILIPSEVSSSLGLSPGMTLVVEEADEGQVGLRIQAEEPLLVDKGGVLVVRAEATEDLAGFTRRERNRRAMALVRGTGL